MMAKEFQPGCRRPGKKKIHLEPVTKSENSVKEMNETMVKVGQPAPEFTAPAYHQGKFVETSLSEYKGKWVLLCFYPGDFTFV